MRASTVWTKIAWALVGALIAVNIYRAATQSITTDEAFTYNTFVNTRLSDAIKFYDANNHVLNSLLSRASVAVLGPSEFSVRLPSVLGGALYLAAAARLCLYVFGGTWYGLLCLGVLSLDPFVLDYLSAARGYGMALGLLMFALDRLIRQAADGRDRLYLAGIAMGLSVAANLVFAVPAIALAAMFAVVALMERRATLAALTDRLALPAVAAAFVLLALPLGRAAGSNYYYGAATLAESVMSIVSPSFTPPVGTSLGQRVAAAVWRYISIAPLIAGFLAAAAGAGALTAIARRRAGSPAGACLAICGGATVLAVAVFVTAHLLGGVQYPLDRTGIYWVPFFALSAFALASQMRITRAAMSVAALLCTVQFVLLFRVSYYGAWTADAQIKHVVNLLRSRERGARRVRIAGSWPLEPALNFYRTVYRLDWMEPVVRGPADAPGDYHVFWNSDANVVEKLHLTVLYQDPLSGMVLAR